MLKKWIGKIFTASAIASILATIFTGIYYNLIKKNHEGPMDFWAILLLVTPLLICVVSMIIINANKMEIQISGIAKKLLKIVETVCTVFAMVILSPILLIMFIPTAIVTLCTEPSKKTFKGLIDKGFTYAHKSKKYTLRKKEIIIEISNSLERYCISFDGGETFVRVEESHLGTSYEREELKYKLNEYLSAHLVDRQRGEVKPPLSDYLQFLNRYLQ